MKKILGMNLKTRYESKVAGVNKSYFTKYKNDSKVVSDGKYEQNEEQRIRFYHLVNLF